MSGLIPVSHANHTAVSIAPVIATAANANPAITAIAANALNAQSKDADDFSFHSRFKPDSRIATLVDLGEKGDVPPKHPTKKIEEMLIEKIASLKKEACDSKNLARVRYELYQLTKINELYFPTIKKEVFDLLIHFLHRDPILLETSHELLKIIMDLNDELDPEKVQFKNADFQKKLVRTLGAAVMLFLRHYQAGHFSNIVDREKTKFLETQKKFNDLIQKENVATRFASKMALEVSKKLTTDKKVIREVLERLANVVKGLGGVYNTDFSGAFSEFENAFKGLGNKISKEWFEVLSVLQDRVKEAKDSKNKVAIIEKMQKAIDIKYGWKFIYGTLEILEMIAHEIQDPNLLDQILEVAENFFDFKKFETVALIDKKGAKKYDEAISNKAKELYAEFKGKRNRILNPPQLPPVNMKVNTTAVPVLNKTSEIERDVKHADANRKELVQTVVVRTEVPAEALKKEDTIDQILEMAQKADSSNCKAVERMVLDKIEILRKRSESSNDLQSVSADLCKLWGISENYFRKAKLVILKLLLQVWEIKPPDYGEPKCLLNIAFFLSQELTKRDNFSRSHQDDGIEMALSFSAAVVLFLKCRETFSKSDQQKFLDAEKKFIQLDLREDKGKLWFAFEMAKEAVRRITSSSSSNQTMVESIEKVSDDLVFQIEPAKIYDHPQILAVGKNRNRILPESEWYQAIIDLAYNDWFAAYYCLKQTIRNTKFSDVRGKIFQNLLDSQDTKHFDWRLNFGILEMIENLLIQKNLYVSNLRGLVGNFVNFRGYTITTCCSGEQEVSQDIWISDQAEQILGKPKRVEEHMNKYANAYALALSTYDRPSKDLVILRYESEVKRKCLCCCLPVCCNSYAASIIARKHAAVAVSK